MQHRQAGFGALEIISIVVAVAALGGAGWFVIQAQSQSAPVPDANNTISQAAAEDGPRRSAEIEPDDPYEGWKTYTSTLGSGLTFRYPTDWVLATGDLAAKPVSNVRGGVGQAVTVFSKAPAGQYMCMTIDEYGGTWDNSAHRLLQPGATLATDRFIANGKTFTLNTHRGDTPMQSKLILVSDPSSSKGSQFFDTTKQFYMTASAQFNCRADGGAAGITDVQADFSAQPETAVARQILKSIAF